MTVFHKRLQVLTLVVKNQKGSQRQETLRQINMLKAKLNTLPHREKDIVSHDDHVSYTKPVYVNTKRTNIRPLCK